MSTTTLGSDQTSSISTKYRIGVDVGGTNTDSVIIDAESVSNTSRLLTTPQALDHSPVVASFKHATTPDVTTGIEIAVKKVIEIAELDDKIAEILSLTIGTTHFVNAVIQSDATKLSKVAVIRLAAPYTTECPPFIDFPKNLERLMNGHTAIIRGGLQIDGRIINDLDENEVICQAGEIRQKGLKNIVVISVFSPLDVEGRFEYRAREILRRELGSGYNIICSRDVGHVGFLERENASILNASITTFAQHTIRSFRLAMKRLGLSCPLYLTQNDGTIITAEEAARLPIKTFASGATNSMRGASFLAGVNRRQGKSVIVVDIGGTTTDVGMLLPSGFPRQAAAFIQVAGVRTNFSMPDVQSIGLGGGSIVKRHDDRMTVGPGSVGNNLSSYSKVFGGTITTATDVVVRAGCASLGDATLASDLDDNFILEAQRSIRKKLEGIIDRMKTNAEDCDLLLVGGGSILAPDSLKGVSHIITPPFHEVANAVGAAIASVSGTVDTIEILHGRDVAKAIEDIKYRAVTKAIAAGAMDHTVQIGEINVLPIQYVTNQATRIIVRAIGELGLGGDTGSLGTNDNMFSDVMGATGADQEHEPRMDDEEVEERIDYKTYQPTINGNEWILTETDLLFMMEGCGVLGTGGGGSPYPTYLICRQIIRDGGEIRVIDHTALPDDALVVRGGFMGSPSVGSERIRGTSHLQLAGMELAKYCGITQFAATLCDEIGGGNGLQSLAMSKYYGIPALDGDLMGRAYPKLNQVLPAVYGRPNALVPCSLHDGDDNIVLLTKVKNDHFVETIMRTVTTEMGSSAALCPPPMEVRDVRDFGVMRSQSQAWRIGRAIAICRQTSKMNEVVNEILKLQNGTCLFVGKIIDVSREVRSGFTWGEIRISPLSPEEIEDALREDFDMYQSTHYDLNTFITIPFQNENLCAYLDKNGERKVLASVPDLITVLDSQSGSHLGTPEYAYGLRVTVIVLAGHPLWRTEKGLRVGGPAAFGLEHEYAPIADYLEPTSVIHEYRPTVT